MNRGAIYSFRTMPIEKLSTETESDVYGIRALVDGRPAVADDWNRNWRDIQESSSFSLLAGVLEGGAATASGLSVTIPSGTIYFARMVWKFTDNTTFVVPDNATTYLWGCSDGVVRQTSSPTPPQGFTTRTACILTKANASSGVASVDNSVQQKARYSDPDIRLIQEGDALKIDYTNRDVIVGRDLIAQALRGLWTQKDTIALEDSTTVAAGTSTIAFSPFTVDGTLIVDGRFKTEDW